jgi:hypothetical protein
MLAVFTVLAWAGCGSGSEGALGQADVSSDCPSADLTCIAQGLDGPLAVFAAVRVNVILAFQGAATPKTRLISSHPEILTVEGSSVRGAAEGNATLLIMLADEDVVLDFLHVWVAAPDQLTLGLFSKEGRDLGEALGSAELLPGEDLVLAARFYARGQKLLGDAEATFSTDSDVVTLLREPTSGRTRVVARTPGHATITVQANGLVTGLELEVKP